MPQRRKKRESDADSLAKWIVEFGNELTQRVEDGKHRSAHLELPGHSHSDRVTGILDEGNRLVDLGLYRLFVGYILQHAKVHQNLSEKSRTDLQRIYGEVVNQYYELQKSVRRRGGGEDRYDTSVR